ncbi:MAG: DUF1844 domain-containing protein [Candidatus Omnitrophota bacterium]
MNEQKKVDESWKEKAKDNEETIQNKSGQDFMPEATFAMLISSLAIQATISLGEIESPLTNKKEIDLKQAKYLIDTLGMLQEKTKNNLTKEETTMMENVLFELRTIFLEKSNSPQLNKNEEVKEK